LSLQVGRETEIACGVLGGTPMPSGRAIVERERKSSILITVIYIKISMFQDL